MKKNLLKFVSVIAVGLFVLGMASVAFGAPELIGAPKCKMCHGAKTGDQFAKWEASKHAGAFTVLASDAAKKIAAEKGIADPQKDEACLKCHTTQAFLGRATVVNATGKYADAEGIGCEACHGPGSDYKSKKVMEDSAAAKAAGLVMNKTAEFCTKCHNEGSPTFKSFDFEKNWAEVAHPVAAK
jgi:hypothetical protein